MRLEAGSYRHLDAGSGGGGDHQVRGGEVVQEQHRLAVSPHQAGLGVRPLRHLRARAPRVERVHEEAPARETCGGRQRAKWRDGDEPRGETFEAGGARAGAAARMHQS